MAVIGMLLLGVISDAQSLEYSPIFRFVEVPSPLSGRNTTYPLVAEPLPAIGKPFPDYYFKTIKTRVTQTNGANGRHEYSRHDPFNCDQSMIVLLSDAGDWKMYRTRSMPYNTTANLVLTFPQQEPRWDRTNPRWLWALEDFSIVRLDVVTGAKTTIKDFAGDTSMSAIIATNPAWRITMKDEGEASVDRRYWAFILQGDGRVDYAPLYIFTWDRVQNKVLGIYHIAVNDREIDWVGMSVLGNYVLVGGDPVNTGTLTGLMMADPPLRRFHKIAYATAHSDVGLDSSGKEVIAMQNSQTDYVDLIPIDWTTVSVNDPGQYPGSHCVPVIRLFYSALPYGLNSGVHVSCNYPGYAVVSTTIAPGLPDQNWLDRSIVLVKLDRARPRVYYLAKIHNTTDTYWEETHASITNDGRKVVWADNWGLNVGQEQMFLMKLDMPPNWELFRTAADRWQLYR